MRLNPIEKSKRANQRRRKAALAKDAKASAKGAQKAQKEKERAAKEKIVTWSLRLPKSVHAQLKAMAKAQGRSANKQVEMLIREASPGQGVAAQDPAPTATTP